MTLGDASGRSVVLTLWNDNAHSPLLDGAEGQVLQVSVFQWKKYRGTRQEWELLGGLPPGRQR